jgi:hypothetical protein
MDQPVPEIASHRSGHDKCDGRSDIRQLVVGMVFSPLPEGWGKRIRGGELRREERLLSRTRESVDRVGAYDDLREGFFVCLSPHAPARPESQRSLGEARLTRPTLNDQLG